MFRRLSVVSSALLLLIVLSLSPGAAEAPSRLREAAELNKTGRTLLEKARYEEAATVFGRMLEACGDHQLCCGVATFYLARCRLERGKLEKAEELLEKAQSIFNSLKKEERTASVLLAKGKLLALKGLYKDSLKCFEKSKEIFKRHKNPGELFVLLSSEAAVLAYMSEYDQALARLDEAQKLTVSQENPGMIALLSNNRGMVHAKRQDYASAAGFYDRASAEYKKLDDLHGMAVVLNNQGQLHEAQSSYSKALACHTQSLELARKAGTPAAEALALNNMGGVYLKTGDYESALQSYEQALQIRKRLGMKHFAAETLNNLGLAHFATGDYGRAMSLYQKAYSNCSEVGSLSCQAWALHNMACLLREEGKLRESVEKSGKAVALADKMGDRRLMATAILRLGNTYEYQGLFDMALKCYESAAKLQQEIGDRNFLSNTWGNMADILARKGDFLPGDEHYKKAIDLKRQIGAPYGSLLAKRALFYLERRNYVVRADDLTPEADLAQAQRIIEEAEQIVSPDNLNDLLMLSYVKGKILLESDPERAIEEFETLKALVAESRMKKFAFLAAVGLGLAYEKLNQWARAEDAFRAAKDYAEEIRTTLEPHARIAFLSGEEILGIKHIVPYEGLARVLLRRGDAAGSWSAAEYTKARAFAERLAQKSERVSFGVPEEVINHDADLHNRLAAIKKQHAKAKEQKNARAEAVARRKERVLEAKLRGHVARFRIEYPLFAATKYPQPITLEESKLNDNEWVIGYDVTDTAVLSYLIRGQTIVKTVFKEVPRRKLDELVRRFREPTLVTGAEDFESKLRSFDFASGKALADLLVGELLSELPEKQPVIIVPDDSLAILPFEMLVLNTGGRVRTDKEIPRVEGTKFLDDRNPISYYQSVTALTLVRTLGTLGPPGDRLLVVADPVFRVSDERAPKGPALASAGRQAPTTIELMSSSEATMGLKIPRLAVTARLAHSLPDLFDGESDVLTGLDASKANLMEKIAPRLRQYGVIVLATHGYFDEDHPGIPEPLLLLTLVPPGTDGVLTMREVLGLNLNAEIVTLLACQTGLGKRLSGEGTMGMGRAFQYGGSRSVLITLWSVAAGSSVELVEDFFRHLRDGRNKLQALRLARQHIRSRGFDHPFFWAPFILVGEVETYSGKSR